MTTHQNEKSEKSEKPKSPRRVSREYAVQTLYTWQLAPLGLEQLLTDFAAQHSFEHADIAYWRELVTQGVRHGDELDECLQAFISRATHELGPVEHAILHIAIYELRDRVDIPYRVIINEAIDLAKYFGAADSHRFINGALDAAAKKLRPIEVAARAARK